MPVLICLRERLWTRTYSIRDQVPTCRVFTRAKIKPRSGIKVKFSRHSFSFIFFGWYCCYSWLLSFVFHLLFESLKYCNPAIIYNSGFFSRHIECVYEISSLQFLSSSIPQALSLLYFTRVLVFIWYIYIYIYTNCHWLKTYWLLGKHVGLGKAWACLLF